MEEGGLGSMITQIQMERNVMLVVGRVIYGVQKELMGIIPLM